MKKQKINRNVRSDYANYLVLSDNCSRLIPTYSGFLEFKKIKSALNVLANSNTRAFYYNGKMYESTLTSTIAQRALDNIELNKYDDAIRVMANKLEIRLAPFSDYFKRRR